MSEQPVDKAVAAYIALRDKKKAIQERHKEELAPINEKMRDLEAWLLKFLLESGSESSRTSHGTAYITRTTKATVQDWDAFKAFIKENDLLDMVEHRVSKEAVTEFIESTGEAPPGVAVATEVNCRIRR